MNLVSKCVASAAVATFALAQPAVAGVRANQAMVAIPAAKPVTSTAPSVHRAASPVYTSEKQFVGSPGFIILSLAGFAGLIGVIVAASNNGTVSGGT